MSIRNRTFRYEVQIAHEGRWIIRNVYSDDRQALSRARSMVHTERMAEAIKVIEFRTAPNGFTTEKELLQIDRLDAYRKQEFQVAPVDEVEFCATHQDLFSLDARRAMEKLLRPYLGPESLTPTEFLHVSAYHKEIDRKGRLVESALHMVARLQAGSGGNKTAKRYDELSAMATDVQNLAQDFVYDSKGLPRLDDHNYKEVVAAIRDQVAPDKAPFYITAAVCHYLMQHRAMMDKLERLVTMLASSDRDAIKILDKLFADAIVAPGLMRDLLGPQISLSDHIKQCLEVLRGNYGVEQVGGQRFLVAVSHLISGGLCPEAGEAIRLHVVRAVTSDTPLDRREPHPTDERRRLEILAQDIAQDDVMGASQELIDKALDRRRRRTRSDLLRQEGLEELADQAL
ncbi:MAG: hypothetical protein AAF213_08800 [Pseudomonadota bacterium]